MRPNFKSTTQPGPPLPPLSGRVANVALLNLSSTPGGGLESENTSAMIRRRFGIKTFIEPYLTPYP